MTQPYPPGPNPGPGPYETVEASRQWGMRDLDGPAPTILHTGGSRASGTATYPPREVKR